MKKILFLIFEFVFLFQIAYAQPIQIVAAENFYGQVAAQIGGKYVHVISIMNNPNQDPHLFSASPKTAEALVHADIVVYSGIDYDPWMQKLLAANTKQPKAVIVVADLMHKKPGDNPHIWYDPLTMPSYATALTKQLELQDPKDASFFAQRLAAFNQEYTSVTKLIATLKAQYQGTPVLATEPVFGYMADALGLKMFGQGFQLSVMNDSEPSIADTADFETKLKDHQVKVLIYNDQVVDPLTDQMKSIALQAGIPIVGVSEMMPLKLTYCEWMTVELSALKEALG